MTSGVDIPFLMELYQSDFSGISFCSSIPVIKSAGRFSGFFLITTSIRQLFHSEHSDIGHSAISHRRIHPGQLFSTPWQETQCGFYFTPQRVMPLPGSSTLFAVHHSWHTLPPRRLLIALSADLISALFSHAGKETPTTCCCLFFLPGISALFHTLARNAGGVIRNYAPRQLPVILFNFTFDC